MTRNGFGTHGFRETHSRTRQIPHPWLWVRVSVGTGAGCPKKPQGCPWQSLHLIMNKFKKVQQQDIFWLRSLNLKISLSDYWILIKVYYLIWLKDWKMVKMLNLKLMKKIMLSVNQRFRSCWWSCKRLSYFQEIYEKWNMVIYICTFMVYYLCPCW